MKITIKHYDTKYSVKKDHDDVTFVDFMEMFKGITKSIYGEDLVEKYWSDEE